MKKKKIPEKKLKRPCETCKFYRILAGRYGVCEKGEHPSDPRECYSFRRKLEEF